MNKRQIYESCENFISELYVNYPRLFKSLNEIIVQYQSNPSISKALISKSLLGLLKDNPALESQLNELLSPEKKAETEPYTFENVQGQITEAFQMIQIRKPEKMVNLLSFFQEKTKDQDQEKNPFEIREKALGYFEEFFKEENDFLKEIKNCFQLKVIEKNVEKSENIENFCQVRKKIKIDNFKEKIVFTPNKEPIFKSVETKLQMHHLHEISPEEIFFANLKVRLSETQMDCFFKVFFLYLENIISNYELFEQLNGFFENNESDLLCFRNMVLSKEVARRRMATFFKPSCEIDLSSSLFFYYNFF